MTSYIVSFTVYTLAMIGIIFIAFVVAKKTIMTGNFSNRENQFLALESSLNIGPRKSLFVVRAGRERFLISSDTEKSGLIAKLEQEEVQDFEEYEDADLNFDSSVIDFPTNTAKRTSMMRGILDRLITEP